MEIIDTIIPELKVIQPKVFGDARGYFFESYNKQQLAAAGLKADFVQDNQSLSAKNVIRGLHFQKPPFAQGKLVRVITGTAMDVAVDIRKGSPTYGQHVKTLLSSEQNNMFWIPAGFAHGFVALEDNTIFAYKTTDYYNKASEGAIRWNDPDIHVAWGIDNPVISDKDKAAPFFKDFESPFIYGEY